MRRRNFVVGCADNATLGWDSSATARQSCSELFSTWHARGRVAQKEFPVIRKPMTSCQKTTALWDLSDPQTSSRGQKSCQLTTLDKEPVRFQLGENLRTRFGASTFDRTDAPRRNIDFDLAELPDAAKHLKDIDDWAIAYITCNSERIFKKKLTRQEVENNYKPLVSSYGVKCKINLRGSRACTFWGEANEPIDAPKDGTWRDFAYTPVVSLNQLWLIGPNFG